MDFGTAITGLIIIAVCILPFALLHWSMKKKQKQLSQSLKQLAKQHNCSISQHEFFRDFAVGIDEASNYIFFYKKTKDHETARHLNLADIQSCKVVNISRAVHHKDSNYKGVGKLELSFTPIAKTDPPVLWVFYDAEESLQLNGELQSIGKWEKLVNERLAQKG